MKWQQTRERASGHYSEHVGMRIVRQMYQASHVVGWLMPMFFFFLFSS